jgi:hypothetical protein
MHTSRVFWFSCGNFYGRMGVMTHEAQVTWELFVHAAEGSATGSQTAERVERVAGGIERMSEHISSQVEHVIIGDVNDEEQRAFKKHAAVHLVQPAQFSQRILHTMSILAETRDADFSGIQSGLRKSAQDVRTIVGGRMQEEFDGNQVGEALQGANGSSKIDVISAATEQNAGESVIDDGQLRNIVLHEHKHERQAAKWNAESVQIVGMSHPLTRTMVSEADAMSVQTTVAMNSAEYQYWFRTVIGLTSSEEVDKTAKSGDLVGLARKMNRRRGDAQKIQCTAEEDNMVSL